MGSSNEEGSVAIEGMGLIFKLLIVSVIFFQISLYVITVTKFNIVTRDVLQRASIDGYIDSHYLKQRLVDLNIDTEDVVIIKTIPNLDEMCNNLGDEILLEVRLDYPISFAQLWTNSLVIICKKRGVNQGYYGEGYVGM